MLEVDWETIGKRKLDLFNNGNKHENCNQINHTYKQGDKFLVQNAWETKLNHDGYIKVMTLLGSKRAELRTPLTPEI